MKRIILIFSVYAGIFMNTSLPVFSVGNGGFYILDGGASGGSYVAGGTALLDWRDFEPVEGQYRWELLTDPNGLFVSWKQYFDRYLCEQANRSNCARLTDPQRTPGVFLRGVPANKKMRLKLRVTEGAIPLWLYGGQDINGVSPSSYGTTCAYKDYDWVPGQPECNAETDIVIAMTYPLYPKKEDNSQPVWWNPIFQEKMKRVIMAIGQKVESDPVLLQAVEFMEASVGSYGEMILYGKLDTFQTDSLGQRLFKRAGYTNAKYSQAVQQTIANYMEAFFRLPIALSMGTGLYASPLDDGSGVTSVLADVLPRVMNRWGSRLYLKFAGFGQGRGGWVGNNFRQYCPHKTRCIYESFGGIVQWPGWPWGGNPSGLQTILNYAVEDKAYIVMMWWADRNAIAATYSGQLEQAFVNVYPRLVELGNIQPSPPPAITPTPTTSFCPNGNNGNLNCDTAGLVNETDLGILLGAWASLGPAPTPATGQRSADLNGDNKVDENDLSRLLSHWKTS